MNYDVVIIGAGPIGGFVSKKISEKGYRVAVIEEHQTVGRPVQCAGLVSPRTIEIADIKNKNIVLNKVRGANIYTPSGHKTSFEAKEDRGIVIDRTAFDRKIIDSAVNAGVDILSSSKAIGAERTNDEVSVKIRQGNNTLDINCHILIGADGIQNNVAKWFDLSTAKEVLSGFGAEVTNLDLNKNFVNILLGREVAPGFFSWLIPINENTARVGLCVSGAKHPAKYYFENLFKSPILKDMLKNSKITEYVAGGIPLGTSKKTYADNVMIVGDAACQVKPLSGGGIYAGLLCAKHCSDIAVKALESRNFSKNILKEYQRLWHKEIGREIWIGMLLRKAFLKLTDKDLEEIFNLLDSKELLKTISMFGDIDYPSKIGLKLILKQPKLLKFAIP
jgi:geranylgeranyl reductase family protein